MKYVLAAFVACLSWAAIGAFAQAASPPGSYQQSCHEISIQGGVLTGLCKTRNGRWQRAALGDVNQCAGDIANLNGALTCGRRTGGLPLYGSGQPPVTGGWQRQEQRRLRCSGIIDPIERERCFQR